MKNPTFSTGEIYHIYNRGVEKRTTFENNGDYLRFVHHLYELNNIGKTKNLTYHFQKTKKNKEVRQKQKRQQLINILAFSLMPNHYHLLVQQNIDNGISKFMQKLGTGYTMFFNEKYERSGALFQGRFKAVRIENNLQLRYIPQYIHFNPLSMCSKKTTHEKYIFLKNYKWSSLPDYLGNHNFPSVIDTHIILELFGDVNSYKTEFKKALKDTVSRDKPHTPFSNILFNYD